MLEKEYIDVFFFDFAVLMLEVCLSKKCVCLPLGIAYIYFKIKCGRAYNDMGTTKSKSSFF